MERDLNELLRLLVVRVRFSVGLIESLERKLQRTVSARSRCSAGENGCEDQLLLAVPLSLVVRLALLLLLFRLEAQRLLAVIEEKKRKKIRKNNET